VRKIVRAAARRGRSSPDYTFQGEDSWKSRKLEGKASSYPKQRERVTERKGRGGWGIKT